jgi:hypothetical protein
MKLASCLVIALAVTACDSKPKDAPKPEPAKAPEPVKPAEPPKRAEPAPKIACDRGITKEIVDKFIPGAETDYGDPFEVPDGGMLTSCRFQEKTPDRRTILQIRCGAPFADLPSYLKAIESQVAVKYERFPSPGRGAYKSSRTFGALHRTLPCVIEAEGMRGDPMIDLAGFVTAIEAQLK